MTTRPGFTTGINASSLSVLAPTGNHLASWRVRSSATWRASGGVPSWHENQIQSRVLVFTGKFSADARNAERNQFSDSPRRQMFPVVQEPRDLKQLIPVVKPGLVVIDSLRAFARVTEKNAAAANWLKEIRRLAREYGAPLRSSITCVNGRRRSIRPNKRNTVATWLLEMEGPPRICESDGWRIASEAMATRLPSKLSGHGVLGDSSLVLLERVYDEDGEPAGYRHLAGVDFLRQSSERRSQSFLIPPANLVSKRQSKRSGRRIIAPASFCVSASSLEL